MSTTESSTTALFVYIFVYLFGIPQIFGGIFGLVLVYASKCTIRNM